MTETKTKDEKKRNTAIGCALAILLLPLDWWIIAHTTQLAWNRVLTFYFPALPMLSLLGAFMLRNAVGAVCGRYKFESRRDDREVNPYASIGYVVGLTVTYFMMLCLVKYWEANR